MTPLYGPILPPLPTLALTTVQQVPSVPAPTSPAEVPRSLAGCPLPPRQSYFGEKVKARVEPKIQDTCLPIHELPSTLHITDQPALGPRECGMPKRIHFATWLIPLVLLTTWAITWATCTQLISNIQREHDSLFFQLSILDNRTRQTAGSLCEMKWELI